jgi:hypothetical protein
VQFQAELGEPLPQRRQAAFRVGFLPSRCAASRTPRSPRDLGFWRCVQSKSNCLAFSLVSPLPSADSADGGTPSLFAGFSGTMELSGTAASVVPRKRACRNYGLAPSPTDPPLARRAAPCERWMLPGPPGFREESFQSCVWSLTPWGRHRTRQERSTPLLPSPCQDKVGHLKGMISELNTQPDCASVNASTCRLPDNPHHSRPR